MLSLLNIFFMSRQRFRSTVLPFRRNVCVSQILLKLIPSMICGMKKRTSLDCLNQQLLIGLYSFLVQPFSDMNDILSVQRHVRAGGKIIILNGNGMYKVPIVTVLKTFLHYSGGHLRYCHGMDSCVTVWILLLCFVLTPILNISVVHKARLILKRLSFLQCI